METIFRRGKRESRFSIISNAPIQDARLSWKARGILVYMLSLPDDWEVHLSEIASHSEKDGRDAFSSGVRELEKLGYVRRIQEKDKNGKFLPMVYEISEIAEAKIAEKAPLPLPQTDLPQTGFPLTAEPQTGNPILQRTDTTKTEIDKDWIYTRILNFWNSKKVLVHKKRTPDIDKAIKKALEIFSIEEIEKGIDVYASVFISKDTWWTHKWTLAEFLSRDKGLCVFYEKTLADYLKTPGDADAAKKKETAARIREQERVDEINKNAQKERAEESEKEAAHKKVLEEQRRWFYMLQNEELRGKIESEIQSHALLVRLSLPSPLPIDATDTAKELHEQKVRTYNFTRHRVEDIVLAQYYAQ